MLNKITIVRAVIIATMLTSTIAASAQEYCFTDKLNYDLAGTWMGDNSYGFFFRNDKRKGTCVSIIEPATQTVRKVRDVVVVNGNLRHLTYYTPSTDGYVSNVNISIKGDQMKYHWTSSYQNKEGDGTYIRQKQPLARQR